MNMFMRNYNVSAYQAILKLKDSDFLILPLYSFYLKSGSIQWGNCYCLLAFSDYVWFFFHYLYFMLIRSEKSCPEKQAQ